MRKALDGLQNLRVVFEFDLVASGQAEYGDEDFFLYLALDPINIGGNVRLAVVDIFLIQIAAEGPENGVIYLKVFCDLRLGAEKVGGEVTDTALEWKENVTAEHGLLKVIGLGFGEYNVRGDAAASVHLPAAVGELNLGRVRVLVVVEIIVKGDVFIITLDEAAAGRVVTGSGKSQASVFTERSNRLHKPLPESLLP